MEITSWIFRKSSIVVANPRHPGRDQRLISVYQFALNLVVLIDDENQGTHDYKDLKPFCFVRFVHPSNPYQLQRIKGIHAL